MINAESQLEFLINENLNRARTIKKMSKYRKYRDVMSLEQMFPKINQQDR